MFVVFDTMFFCRHENVFESWFIYYSADCRLIIRLGLLEFHLGFLEKCYHEKAKSYYAMWEVTMRCGVAIIMPLSQVTTPVVLEGRLSVIRTCPPSCCRNPGFLVQVLVEASLGFIVQSFRRILCQSGNVRKCIVYRKSPLLGKEIQTLYPILFLFKEQMYSCVGIHLKVFFCFSKSSSF